MSLRRDACGASFGRAPVVPAQPVDTLACAARSRRDGI